MLKKAICAIQSATSTRMLGIVGSVCLYWLVSLSMVFLNKFLLSSDQFQLDAPVFITWTQCVVTFLMCLLHSFILNVKNDTIKLGSGEKYAQFRWELRKVHKVLPLAVIFVAMVYFNNVCLKYVEVSFYFIGRSLTSVFSALFTYIILGEKTSYRALVCCGIIIIGFYLGVDQEHAFSQLSVKGCIYGVLASMAVALNAIFTKKVLPTFCDVWELTAYNNMMAIVLFVPVIFIMQEWNELIHFRRWLDPFVCIPLLLSGILGFGMSYATALQIKLTSPLTHNVSGTAKSCLQTVISYVYNQESKSLCWWIGNFAVMLGSLAYARVRQYEMNAKAKKTELSKQKQPGTFPV